MPPVDVTFTVVDPRSADAVASVRSYFDELDHRFPNGFDPVDATDADAAFLDAPSGAFIVGHVRGRPITCGGVQRLSKGVAEIKRMWVEPGHRGLGIGKRMLSELEDHAARLGYDIVRLDTNTVLTEAIAMYVSAGYVEIERYNDNPYARHFFEKQL
jgi:GNAT superfamily N-acetyltransferase